MTICNSSSREKGKSIEIQGYWPGIVLSRWLSFLVMVHLLNPCHLHPSELFGTCWKQHIVKCFYGIEIVQHHPCPPLAAQLHWLMVQVGTRFWVVTCAVSRSLPGCKPVFRPWGNSQLVGPKAVESTEASRVVALKALSLWLAMGTVPWPQKSCIQHKIMNTSHTPTGGKTQKFSWIKASIIWTGRISALSWAEQAALPSLEIPAASRLWEKAASAGRTAVPITGSAAWWCSFLMLTDQKIYKHQLPRGTQLKGFILSRQLPVSSLSAVAAGQ